MPSQTTGPGAGASAGNKDWEKLLLKRVRPKRSRKPISTGDDLTFALDYKDKGDELTKLLTKAVKPETERPNSFPLPGDGGRYHLVSAERQQKLFGTLRPTKDSKPPDTGKRGKKKRGKKNYVTSPDVVAKLVLDSGVLLGKTQLPPGLLLISGRTGAAKTKLAASLIAQLTELVPAHVDTLPQPGKGKGKDKDKRGKRHVLITAEDPAEIVRELQDYFSGWKKRRPRKPPAGVGDKEEFEKRFFAIERDLNFDGSLNQILLDALRQTPSVVYIGELRRHHDFEQAFNFARTGHLVIATFHAGSLRGAFEVLFERLRKRSIQDRAIIADTLLGLIYMQKLNSGDPQDEARNWELLCPACWWSQPATRKTLSAHGLGAIMFDDPADKRPSIPGHTWFARKILDELPNKKRKEMGDETTASLRKAAVDLDINQS